MGPMEQVLSDDLEMIRFFFVSPSSGFFTVLKAVSWFPRRRFTFCRNFCGASCAWARDDFGSTTLYIWKGPESRVTEGPWIGKC